MTEPSEVAIVAGVDEATSEYERPAVPDLSGRALVRTFDATLERAANGAARVAVPFNPDDCWGVRKQHRIGGLVGGMGVRGSIVNDERGWSFTIGAAWLRDCPIGVGDHVAVAVFPEGPQRADLAPDLADALAANPDAAACWDCLAQFYRKAYLRWIDATKRKPELRATRIAEVVALLAQGIKQRPDQQ